MSARLLKQVEPFSAAPDALLNLSLPLPPRLKSQSGGSHERSGFTLAFFTRMLFSCLVDADFLDTEAFVDPERGTLRRGGDRASCAELLVRLNTHLEEKQRRRPTRTSTASVVTFWRRAEARRNWLLASSH